MNMTRRLSAIIVLVAGGAHSGLSQSNPFTITPSPVILCGQPGQAISGVPVSIAIASGSVTFIATGFTSDGNWLDFFPNFATASPDRPALLLVGINGPVIPLANGDYTGQIVLGSLDGAKLATIPISLQVSAAGCGSTRSGSFFANSGPLTFQLPAGLPSNGNTQVLLIFNSFRTNLVVAPTVTTSTGQKWLTSVGTNLTLVTGPLYPTPMGVGIGTEGLSAGTYTGNIELNASNGTMLDIPITLNVSGPAGGPRFVVTPSPLSIGVAKGTTATTANFQLTNLAPSPVSVSLSTNAAIGRNWLTASPASAVILPNATIDLTATITAAGLVDGPNSGNINVQVTSGSGGSLAIPVTVNYGFNSELSVAPNPLNITTPPGASNPTNAVVTVSANSGVVSFTANPFSSLNQPWLSVNPFNATASPGKPVNLTVSVQPALLPIGPAIGVITLKHGDGSTAGSIPVNVNAGKDATLSVTPAQLSFAYPAGAAAPPAQSLSLTSTASTNYSIQTTTSNGGNWLIASPVSAATSGAAPAKLTAQVNPSGLPPNTYQGQIIITNTSSGAQQMVPVTLTVTPPISLSANPAALTFYYQAGAPAIPIPQAVQVTSVGGSTRFTATTAGVNGAPDFLTLTSSDGNTPGTVMVGLNPLTVATLPAGEYNAVVKISSPGVVGSDQTLSVTLIVSPIPPKLESIVNAASLAPGAVSPGEIVTIFGSGLGPALGTSISLTAQGTVPTTLAGVGVTFDGFAAPLIYVGAQQINAIVPYEIAGRVGTQLIISRNGVDSLPLLLQVVDTAPAIFSATQNGNGQGAILNADNSYNGPDNPAVNGSVIQIFATGEGLYFGATTGSVTPARPPFPAPIAAVTVTIGGQPAQVQYAGEAPGLISGVLQVNAVVPLGAGSGPQKVVLTLADNPNKSQTINVAVQ
jgi:uncharacterized protein (TIGR03437 family)